MQREVFERDLALQRIQQDNPEAQGLAQTQVKARLPPPDPDLEVVKVPLEPNPLIRPAIKEVSLSNNKLSLLPKDDIQSFLQLENEVTSLRLQSAVKASAIPEFVAKQKQLNELATELNKRPFNPSLIEPSEFANLRRRGAFTKTRIGLNRDLAVGDEAGARLKLEELKGMVLKERRAILRSEGKAVKIPKAFKTTRVTEELGKPRNLGLVSKASNKTENVGEEILEGGEKLLKLVDKSLP